MNPQWLKIVFRGRKLAGHAPTLVITATCCEAAVAEARLFAVLGSRLPAVSSVSTYGFHPFRVVHPLSRRGCLHLVVETA
jgi:hypothetical protein